MRTAGLLLLALGLVACGPDGRDDGTGGDDTGGGSGSDMTGGGGGGGGGGGEMVYVYAHTASTLFRVDPDTLNVQTVGAFQWGSVVNDSMTDIAIDKTGKMIGISYSRVYSVDPTNAKATLLSNSLGGNFNGLSFVPAAMLGMTGDDVLVAVNNADGRVMKIDPTTGAATQVGNMGGAYKSSGDLVAVDGFGTAQTVTGSGSDVLAKLAPNTFAATPVGTGTGFGEIWGVAFWKGKIFGFTNGGAFVLIDATSGTAQMVSQTSNNWWGAAVTTIAPVLQ